MRKLSGVFVAIVERWYPDPFVFAIILTFVTLVMALALTAAGPVEAVLAWGKGLEGLLTFIAQIAITLITAHALAHTDAVLWLLQRLAGLPRSAAAAYWLVAFVATLASLCAWSLGLVAGAIVARQVAVRGAARGLRLHYPLLVASAYAGFVVWHMGYSSSAALFVATPGHALEQQIGGTIPVGETILSWGNVITALVTLALVPIVCALMRPDDEEVVPFKQPPPRQLAAWAEPGSAPEDRTPAQRLDHQRLLSAALGLLLAAYLAYWFAGHAFDLTLNIVNWSFLALGLLLARSPAHYVQLIADASASVGQIVLQYPFYAGIMGLMMTTGLVDIIAGWFTRLATAGTLPLLAFFAAGVINFFIPSGGGQWAVQGPVFIEAARQLGVEPARIVLAVAYGDQWTNMIQPFWTIPLLAVAGAHMREIMGYTFVILLVTMVIFGGGLLLAG